MNSPCELLVKWIYRACSERSSPSDSFYLLRTCTVALVMSRERKINSELSVLVSGVYHQHNLHDILCYLDDTRASDETENHVQHSVRPASPLERQSSRCKTLYVAQVTPQNIYR